jgi:hypothetical protein
LIKQGDSFGNPKIEIGLGLGGLNRILSMPRLRFKPPRPPEGTTDKERGEEGTTGKLRRWERADDI